MLTCIPQNVGGLTKLKCLDISKNSLCDLPGNMTNLHLLRLDVSDNPFTYDSNINENRQGIASLIECAAKVVLKTRCEIFISNTFFFSYNIDEKANKINLLKLP